MSENRHFEKIIPVLMAFAVLLCVLAMLYADKLSIILGGTGVTMEYEYRLFDTDEIMSVDIQMDGEQWNKMLKNAASEEYYICDAVINGEKITNIAIRPKGNTSLSAIAMDPDTDRFSFKLEFDHYVEGQTCYGLDKLILNNNYADATNMKEAVVYDMYQYLGADASLYNYAKVSVNGEYWGLYLALEAVEQSFMLRSYGVRDGELYKPDTMDMGDREEGETPSSPQPEMPNMPDMGGFDPNNAPDMGGFDPNNAPNMGGFDPNNAPNMGDFDPNNAPDMGGFDPDNSQERPEMNRGFGGGRNSGGANLNYTDDELDSYSEIWDAEVTKTGKKDHRRVIEALKNISQGNDLEKYLDVDNVLKYMAVHAFSVNMDSLSGNMSHNYYLYEYKGQLNIIPWDYNLSFGGMAMGMSSNSAGEMINDAIDTPFSATEFFDALLENEEYLARYHGYLRQLTDEYIFGGRFDQVYSSIRSRIDELVKTDPTAFYTYEEYQVGADMLYDTARLRAESIQGQLDGTIPSTDASQRENSSSLIDASGIDISAMGIFNMGGFGGENDTGKSPAQPQPGNEKEVTGGFPFSDGSFDPANVPNGISLPDMQNMLQEGGTANDTYSKNAVEYVVCMAVLLAALTAVTVFKRRKHAR